MGAQGMYGEHAELYDLIYHFKDYGAEVERVVELLRAHGVPEGGRLLDAACGTGAHLAHLAPRFDVTGLDGSDAMLAIARKKVPGAAFVQADLADFHVDRPFDAALCLFSSIGYLLGEQSLGAAAGCFARALRAGGVLVVEPWVAPEDFHPGSVHLHTYASEELKLVRASHSRAEGERSILDFHWIVARAGVGIEHFQEQHVCWLCPRERMAAIIEDAGFEVGFESDGLMEGRGVFVARKR